MITVQWLMESLSYDRKVNPCNLVYIGTLSHLDEIIIIMKPYLVVVGSHVEVFDTASLRPFRTLIRLVPLTLCIAEPPNVMRSGFKSQ